MRLRRPFGFLSPSRSISLIERHLPLRSDFPYSRRLLAPLTLSCDLPSFLPLLARGSHTRCLQVVSYLRSTPWHSEPHYASQQYAYLHSTLYHLSSLGSKSVSLLEQDSALKVSFILVPNLCPWKVEGCRRPSLSKVLSSSHNPSECSWNSNLVACTSGYVCELTLPIHGFSRDGTGNYFPRYGQEFHAIDSL